MQAIRNKYVLSPINHCLMNDNNFIIPELGLQTESPNSSCVYISNVHVQYKQAKSKISIALSLYMILLDFCA